MIMGAIVMLFSKCVRILRTSTMSDNLLESMSVTLFSYYLFLFYFFWIFSILFLFSDAIFDLVHPWPR